MIGAFQAGVLASKAADKIYARFSPTRKNSNITLSNGNLTMTTSATFGAQGVYLDTDKTSGLWIVSFTVNDDSDNRAALGVANTLTTNNLIGSFAQGIGFNTPQAGAQRKSDSLVTNNNTAGYWKVYNSSVQQVPIIIDYDNRQILALDPAGTALKASNAATITGNFYVGLSMNLGGSAVTSTLNSGESEFPADFIAAVEAYEIANAVTINRGLWS